MTVLSTYIKRVYSKPWMILLTLAVPVLIVVISNAGGGQSGLRVALYDDDNSVLSRAVADAIAPVSRFVDIDRSSVEQALVEARIEYALILPSGLQERVLRGEQAVVESYSLHGVEVTGAIEAAADSVFSAAHAIAGAVDERAEEFELALARTLENGITVNAVAGLPEGRAMSRPAATGLAQLVAFVTVAMFFSTLILSQYFLEDRKVGVFHRTLAGPISLRGYMLETNGAFLLVTALQAVATAATVVVVFRELPATAGLLLGLTLVLCALVAVSFALAIAGLSTTLRRSQLLFNLILMPMVMLGGAFWPVEIMPPLFQRIAAFTPIMWVVEATEQVLQGAGFSTIAPHLGVLLLFAVVFQLLSSWRRVDVAR